MPLCPLPYLLKMGRACALVRADFEILVVITIVDQAFGIVPEDAKNVQSTVGGSIDGLFFYHDYVLFCVCKISGVSRLRVGQFHRSLALPFPTRQDS